MKSTHRSSKGPKLYSIRDKHSRFKDIQKYKREHKKDQKKGGEMKKSDIEYQQDLEKTSNALFALRKEARQLLSGLGKEPARQFHRKMYRLIQKVAFGDPYLNNYSREKK